MSFETIEQQTACLLREFKYPPYLGKACGDSFFYAMKLRTGEIIEFSEAEAISASWVRIKHIEEHTRPAGYLLDRGMDVRVADIVWIADAPNGS